MQGADLVSVSQRWQSRIAASPDYVVVPHDNVFRMGMYPSAIGESAYDIFGRYLRELCSKYKGIPLEKAISGTILMTEEGPCYCIKSVEPACIEGPLPQNPALYHELRLVHGICAGG